MKVTWLGWAGVEVEADGAAVVIDPLADPGATFAALGDQAERATLPSVVAPRADRAAVAGLVTHLHRDHADAGALAGALADDAVVHHPARPGGEDVENLALAQAEAELERANLTRRAVEPWQRVEAGPFALTGLPAVDGLGDPQVSWLVEADGRRALHLGDTVFHGYWWRIARRHGPFDVVFAPINGPVVDFPHLQPPSPLPAAMEPEQAALAGELLGARTVIPIHYDGFAIDPWYRPVPDAASRFAAAAAGRPYEARALEPGESLEAGRHYPIGLTGPGGRDGRSRGSQPGTAAR
jgi:L-ascorbate metabolism protein UlaG (beta-lactamase superfamily)